jgi:hypothetical protein
MGVAFLIGVRHLSWIRLVDIFIVEDSLSEFSSQHVQMGAYLEIEFIFFEC